MNATQLWERVDIGLGDLDKPFLLPVEDVFSISGRGTVATGRVGISADFFLTSSLTAALGGARHLQQGRRS